MRCVTCWAHVRSYRKFVTGENVRPRGRRWGVGRGRLDSSALSRPRQRASAGTAHRSIVQPSIGTYEAAVLAARGLFSLHAGAGVAGVTVLGSHSHMSMPRGLDPCFPKTTQFVTFLVWAAGLANFETARSAPSTGKVSKVVTLRYWMVNTSLLDFYFVVQYYSRKWLRKK